MVARTIFAQGFTSWLKFVYGLVIAPIRLVSSMARSSGDREWIEHSALIATVTD